MLMGVVGNHCKTVRKLSRVRIPVPHVTKPSGVDVKHIDAQFGGVADHAQRNFLVCFINGVAALLFIVSGAVDWSVALIVMVGSISGGYFGARTARHIPNEWLRQIVTAAGAIFSVYYFVKAYG